MKRIPSHLVWLGAAGCLLVAGSWTLRRQAAPPPPVYPEAAPEALGAASPTPEQPTAPSRPTPTAQSIGPHERVHPFAQPSAQPYWQDPSIDPEVLARAFAEPPRSLPPAARPTDAAIHPPERVWRQMQRDDKAVAY